MTAVISVRKLNKSFPGVRALQDCQFDLLAGEVHALMGENGAGKSTLMKILSGVYQKDSGQILLEGREVDIATPRMAENFGIGIVHQELNLMNHLSAAQNIFIGHEPTRYGVFVDNDALNRDAQAIFDRMNLRLDPRVLVGELTVAKQQMVEIAKSLARRTRVLIMDEPTAALNNVEIEDLFRILHQLKAEGVGIVYISHKMDEIERIADRVTVMRDGCYIDTVLASEPMEKIIGLMVGRTLDVVEKNIPDTDRADVVLEVKNLCRGKFIKDVSFTIRKGEIVGFAGLMGAGRTEVARAVFGADKIDGGEIYIHGKKVMIRSPADAVRLGIGYLSEDRKHFGLALGMDVKANVVLAHMQYFLWAKFFLSREKIQTIANQMVQKLRIKTPTIEQSARLLSGGNQQKIVIAKWLVRDCDILFFDEPTRGIDVGAKSEIYKLINDLAAQGRAIVMISSELPEVLRMSHRVLVMCEGRLTGEIAGANATQENIMKLAVQHDGTTVH